MVGTDPQAAPSVSARIKPGQKIVLVGDFPRKQDLQCGIPLMGSDGQELNRILEDAGLRRRDCGVTTVFTHGIPENKIENICDKKAAVGGRSYPYPPIKQGKYIRPEFLAARDRLRAELEASDANVVVALGPVACWALLDNPKITVLRGTVNESTLVPGLKVIPTYHPATIFAQYKFRVVALLDLTKVERESHFPDVRRISRKIWIEPTLDDIREFKRSYLDSADHIGYDIETAAKQITCIGFAPDPTIALVIPFVDERQPDFNYWRSREEELEAWRLVKQILRLRAEKITQNGMYDKQYLFRIMGIAPRNDHEDTMLMHHALQPEIEKSLGFLGSIYCNEAAWKQMRKRKATDKSTKADE